LLAVSIASNRSVLCLIVCFLSFQPAAKLQAKQVCGVPVAEGARPRPLEEVQGRGGDEEEGQCLGDTCLASD